MNDIKELKQCAEEIADNLRFFEESGEMFRASEVIYSLIERCDILDAKVSEVVAENKKLRASLKDCEPSMGKKVFLDGHVAGGKVFVIYDRQLTDDNGPRSGFVSFDVLKDGKTVNVFVYSNGIVEVMVTGHERVTF